MAVSRTRTNFVHLSEVWEAEAERWIQWARTPGHDSYWRFHRDLFLRLLPPPGRRTVDVGCGEGRFARDLKELGHRVVAIDSSPSLVAAAREFDPSMDICLADAAALPLKDASADLAVAFMSLQDIDEDAFPDPPLWPSDVNARARARLLELKCDEIVFMNIARLFGLEDKRHDPIAVDARAKAHQHYAQMDARLEGRDLRAGAFSDADIALFMVQFYGERKGAVMTESTRHLLEWRKRVLQRPAIRKVIGRMGAWLQSEGRASPVYIEDAVMAAGA